MALAPTLRIATLQARFPIVDPKTGIPTPDFIDALNTAFQNAAVVINNQSEILNAIAVVDAKTDTAQATAEAAQAAVDAIEVPPSGTRTVTANTAVTATDSTINVDATAGTVIVTLLGAASPYPVTIKKVDATANIVRIAAQPGETINGAASFDFTTPSELHYCTNNGLDEWYA